MAPELQASLLIVLCALPCVFGGDDGWRDAHATFYGPPEGTIGGACGLQDFKDTYAPYTAALSAALFKDAASCGACYELKCENSTGHCKTTEKAIIVTATDLCPTGDGKWCGHQYFNLVTVSNVGGSGDVAKVEVNPEGEEKWTQLKRNWGEKWETNEALSGKSLNFRVTTNDGKTVTSRKVAPKGWQYGQTFEGKNSR
nr:expansin-A9-like [Ipomoea trifida]